MKITLTYRGRIPSARSGGGKDKVAAISDMRLSFHNQLARLWGEHPFEVLKEWEDSNFAAGAPNFIRRVSGVNFVPFYDERKVGIAVGLEINLLSGQPKDAPKVISAGDLDNRIKSVIDALHPPQKDSLSQELTALNRVYCLMSDDEAVKEISASTRPFLDSKQHDDAFVIVEARPMPIRISSDNIAMAM